jgi:hypothetical protein
MEKSSRSKDTIKMPLIRRQENEETMFITSNKKKENP